VTRADPKLAEIVLLSLRVSLTAVAIACVAGFPLGATIAVSRFSGRQVGLAALGDGPARVLSGGEQQRGTLARALALNPEVLFLDEPTANLDPGATHEIERVISLMHAAVTKIVMVTHNLGQARRLADEILFLHRGRLLERTSVDVFFKRPASVEAAQFLEGELPW